MPRRIDYPVGYWKGKVEPDTSMVEICKETESGWYVYVQKLTVSIFKAATEAGGEILLKLSDGTEIWKMDADVVKDVVLDFGEEGLSVGLTGLQVIAANAAGEQAEAWVLATGYKSLQDKG